MDPWSLFKVRAESGKYDNKWVVFRNRDNKVMTEGGIFDCLRWINVWGLMRQ